MRKSYRQYAHSGNLSGSGRASSYVRALDLLQEMIKAVPKGFSDCENIWSPPPIERLHELYHFVCDEKKKGEASEWNLPELPKSYLLSGYCSAALRDYQSFLVEYTHEESLMKEFENHQGSEDQLVQKLDREMEFPDWLLNEMVELEGKEVVKAVKVRSNQRVFRRIVMGNYNRMCCITGLEVDEINRASHIVPWSVNTAARMDPRNGLYLSATYDAAFDRHLISLDDDYRVILAHDLKGRYTSESFQRLFVHLEGTSIRLPESFLPKKEYLEEHRASGQF